MDTAVAIQQAAANNRRLNSVISEFEFITEARITYNNTNLVGYMNLLYDRALYNTLQGYWHASPGLIAILVAIWGVVVFVYKLVTFIVNLLRLKEILQVAGLLRILWPAFRVKYDEILGQVSEFSQQIGLGVDGLIHLLTTAQGGLNVLKGVTGKSFEWLQIAGAEKAISSLTVISAFAYQIERNPAGVLNLAFTTTSQATSREIQTWWDSTFEWLTNMASTAERAIQKVNDTIDNLLELENKLPQFIRDNIPDEVFDSIRWADDKINNNILPVLTNIANELTEINAQLQAERDKAEALAAQLMLPGDLLTNIDSLSPEEKANQELKIDDVTSRLYEKQTDVIYQSDQEVIEGLESVRKLAALALPELPFMSVEETIRPGIVYSEAEKIVGWFVGDF